MKNRIQIINGSVRPDGNTDAAINEITTMAESLGRRTDIRVANLRELKIGGCTGCFHCRTSDTCSVDDDMGRLVQELQEAHTLVFATPMYWSTVPGLMKTFLDRLFFFYHKPKVSLQRKRAVYVISMMSQEATVANTYIFKKLFEEVLNVLSVKQVSFHFFDDVFDKNALQVNQGHASKIEGLGREILRENRATVPPVPQPETGACAC